MGGKFKISAQGCDLAPKFGNVTTTMISSDKKPPLMTQLFCKKHPLTHTYAKNRGSGNRAIRVLVRVVNE